MATLYRFYSTLGRSSIARFVGVALIAALILFAISRVDWLWGLGPNILAGAIGGAALAKLLVEAIRRFHDNGISLRIAAWLALLVGVATGVALYAVIISDPPWAQSVLTVVTYGAPPLCTVALLWPSRRRQSDRVLGSTRAGTLIAALFVVGGAMVMGFIAWLSIGMDANNRRAVTIQAELDRADQLP